MADEPDGALAREPIPAPRADPDASAAPDAGPEGTESDGTGPDGTESDGTRADRTRADRTEPAAPEFADRDSAEREFAVAGQGRDGTARNRRWSLPSLLILSTAVIAVALAVLYHLGTVFLAIAPSNPVSQRDANAISAHVMPEFEQNWQLFAPNPLQQNIAIQARVQTISADGSRADSPWIDLTAQDIAAIRDNPFPSHVNQNLLRRAWDYYAAWHDQNDKSTGFGGPLSVEYLKRIALQRIGRDWQGQPVIQIQFRSATTDVTGPPWTGAPASAGASYRELPWWPATTDDYSGLGVSR